MPDCSRTFEHSRGESDGRNPCAGNAAIAADKGGIENPVQMKQAEGGPREVTLPKVKPRFQAIYFEPRRLFFQAAALPPSLPTSLHYNSPTTTCHHFPIFDQSAN